MDNNGRTDQLITFDNLEVTSMTAGANKTQQK